MLEPVEDRSGLRVAGPTDTLVACARDLGLLDLVALIDAALHSGECSVPQLESACRPQRREAPALRRALRYADGRAESPWESLLRMLHVLCGIRVDSQVVVGPYRADLRIVGTRRLPEYDGAYHRDGEQHARDLARDRFLTGDGWERYGYTRITLVQAPVTVLRDADEAVGRPHVPAAIRPWVWALAGTCVTAAGRDRLRRRWRV